MALPQNTVKQTDCSNLEYIVYNLITWYPNGSYFYTCIIHFYNVITKWNLHFTSCLVSLHQSAIFKEIGRLTIVPHHINLKWHDLSSNSVFINGVISTARHIHSIQYNIENGVFIWSKMSSYFQKLNKNLTLSYNK